MKRLAALLFFVVLIFSCAKKGHHGPHDLTIISGSENKTLMPLIREFENKHGVSIGVKFKGSLDIMIMLKDLGFQYDAVWPANSLWIKMGDVHRKVKHVKSIMTSPVVLGLKKSIAKRLGWINKSVSVNDIYAAIKNKEFKFLMTSATQSNSGASAFLGFLYAFLNNPDVIRKEHLNNPQLKMKMKSLLKAVDRTSGSSGWLKTLFLSKSVYKAMFNYEALIIETNKELIANGQEPLYVIYPTDGLVIADSPLGYYNKGDKKKEELFLKLQNFLLSNQVQDKLMAAGRRASFGGFVSDADKDVWNPKWGINTKKILSPIKYPRKEVLEQILELYQTVLRKPSYTIFCLDFSGSMGGRGERLMKQAMSTILNQRLAREYYINATPQDVTVVIPFSGNILGKWELKGNNPTEMMSLLKRIENFSPGGKTDIYTPAIEGLKMLANADIETHMPSIIIMTDGVSNYGASFNDLERVYKEIDRDIPIFSIRFGNADKSQLIEIEKLTGSRIFDGRKDLIMAFKKAKGYN